MHQHPQHMRELAAMCGGLMLLVLAAVGLQQGVFAKLGQVPTQTQAAATWLGDQQGVPPGYTGNMYPDYTACFINGSFYQYAPGYGPTCLRTGWGQPGSPYIGSFYSSVFSVHAKGSSQGQTVYADSQYNYQTASTYDANGVYIPAQVTHTLATVGTATVPAGDPLVLEWSCLPQHTVYYEYKTGQGLFSSGHWAYYSIYSLKLATGAIAMGGPGFGTGGTLYGSTTISAPATEGTYNYTVQCAGGDFSTPKLTIPLVVTPAQPKVPTLSIAANGSNNIATVAVGQPVAISATFVASPGDTLTYSAINDNNNNLWCGSTGVCDTSMWSTDLGSKTYNFVSTQPGTYIFYPAVLTAEFPTWSNYGQSLIVHVVDQCLNGQGPVGACTSCNTGYTLSAGSCVAQCQNGTGTMGSCSACNKGYTLVGGSCVGQCPNGKGLAGSCTSCNPGYVLVSGSCTQPSIDKVLSANASRVQKGGSVVLSWSTAGMDSCQLTSNTTQGVISTGLSSSGTTIPNITNQTTFTLTCRSAGTAYTSTTVVGVIPAFQEI